jgi:hypothetical protein
VDEAHHLLPASWSGAGLTLPRELDGILFITVHPQLMAAPALSASDLIIAVGRSPENLIQSWSAMLALQPAGLEPTTLEFGEALAWRRGQDSPVFRFKMAPPRVDRRRHQRKYAEGEIPDYHSFYFRGPHGKLNLRAQNLNLFLQLADGVDDATWLHHLRRGDYSRWFRDVIRDEDLAVEASRVEIDLHLDAQATRAAIHAAVEQRYTRSA